MAKFCGKIGYAKRQQTAPGVWRDDIIEEHTHFGDVLQFYKRWENGEHLNDDLNVNHKISIISDPFICENFQSMKYVVWRGVKWKITNIEEAYPRFILTIGGVYHG